MKKKALLFDFDGVIVNTFELCLGINRKVGNDFSREEYQKLFESNIFEELDTHRKEPQSEYDEGKWFSHYSPAMLKLDPVEGILDALRELGERYVLVVVSSTINSPIEEYLEKHDVWTYFDKVFGSDVHKSKVEKIKMIFSEFDLSSEDCLFITDTLGDMREATETEVESIGVSWGFHPSETLLKGNPFKVVDASGDLVAAVGEYFAQ